MSNLNQTAPHAPRDTNPRKSSIGCLTPFLIVLAIFMIIGHFLSVGTVMLFFSGSSVEDNNLYTGQDGYIAVLHIEGVITTQSSSGSLFSDPDQYRHGYLMQTLYDLSMDSDNKGILLYIDSPGGQVYATDELYLEIMKYKSSTGRPVYAYLGQTAASGGYYIAAAADQIFMNRNGITGSIGVSAGTFIDLSDFLEEQGIRTTSLYVGDNKAMGSMFEEFTAEQRAIYMSVLQETYDQFVDVVTEGRPLTRDQVVRLSDGRIFSANQALEHHLIDGVMTFEEACSQLISDMDWSSKVQFIHYRPDTSVSFADLFLMFSRGPRTDLEAYLSYLDIPFEGFAYYYEGPRF